METLNALFAGFFASGHAADLVLGVLALEAVWLKMRGWRWARIVGLLGPAGPRQGLGLAAARRGRNSGAPLRDERARLGREVAEVGLDAMQLYSLDPGHGYHPRREELEAFLIEVLEAVTCPVVLSSHQAMGYGLPPDLVAQMLERFPHVIGINFTNPDLGALVRMLEAVDGRVDVHVGGPMQTLTALALGATGYLSSEGNLAPRLCQSVIAHHRMGELLLRDAAFAKLLLLHVATQRLGGASAAKGALRELGLPGGWPRRPRLPVSDEHARELAACFESLGLREVEDVS